MQSPVIKDKMLIVLKNMVLGTPREIRETDFGLDKPEENSKLYNKLIAKKSKKHVEQIDKGISTWELPREFG